MNFSDFLNLVPKIQNQSLPGEVAHLKMSPPERKTMLENLDYDSLNARSAAVMVLIYSRNEQAHLVLILRNAYKGIHSSQVALPGGKPEKVDGSLEETALRETFEEIGILPNAIQSIRALSPIYIPPSNFLVHPFLSFSEEDLIFYPDAREVAGIIEVELKTLLDDSVQTTLEMPTSYSEKVVVPGYRINEKMVWGATAMILSELADLIKAAQVAKDS